MADSDAPIHAQQSAQWREPGQRPTPEREWPRSQTCPRAGEERWVWTLSGPRYSAPVWILFQPGSGGPDAWRGSLDDWALVECEVTNHLHPVWKRDKRGRARHLP